MPGHTIILDGSRARDRAKRLMDSAPPGAVVEVRPPRRTLDQNAMMWALLSDISRAMPEGRRYTPDEWKQLFMHACGWEVQFLEGLDGRPFPAGFRSSRMSKAQMADLITFIQQWGDEHGVEWSNETEAATTDA